MSAPEPRSMLAELLKRAHVAPPDGEPALPIQERRCAIVQIQARHGQEATLKAAVSSDLGLDLPKPGRATSFADLAAVWIQPGAWLVTAPLARPDDLTKRLRDAVARHAAMTDQTFGKTILRLSGGPARDVLAKGCRIDLHPRVFRPGSTAVTLLGQVGCTVVQADDTPTFDLIVPSTFAGAALEGLQHAAEEFGFAIVAH